MPGTLALLTTIGTNDKLTKEERTSRLLVNQLSRLRYFHHPEVLWNRSGYIKWISFNSRKALFGTRIEKT